MKTERMWKTVLKEFPEDAPADRIESTAQYLEGMNYEPVLLLKAPGFLRMGRRDVEAEVERVLRMTDEEMMAEGFSEDADFSGFKDKHLKLLIYHYNLLCRLRNNEPTAWDVINELMEDD